MADKPQPPDLESVLARLEGGWQELATALRAQAQPETRVVEAQRFVLVDASGRFRGKLAMNDDGSAALVLADADGKFRAWLGLKEDGSPFLSLRDRFGALVFEAPLGSRPPEEADGAAPGGGEAQAPPEPPAAPPDLERLEKLEAEVAALREALKSPSRSAAAAPAAPAEAVGSQITERLARVERRGGRLRLLGAVVLPLLLLTMAGLGLVWNRAQLRGEPVETESLSLRGANGAPRALLEERGGAVRLELLDQEGKSRAALALGADGEASLGFWGPAQKPRAWLGERAGSVSLHLCDSQGRSGALLTMGREGEPGLRFYDQDQRARIDLGLWAQGETGLNLVDDTGKLRLALGGINPGYQNPAAPLSRPPSSLVLFNPQGYPVWRAPLSWYGPIK